MLAMCRTVHYCEDIGRGSTLGRFATFPPTMRPQGAHTTSEGARTMERITVKNARASLAHYARTLAGHGILTVDEAGAMRLGTPYGQALYVYISPEDGSGKVRHDVPGFRGDSKSVGTTPKDAQIRIIQAHTTIGDLYSGSKYDHEAGERAHRQVMEHYGYYAEYARIFSVGGN